MYKNKENNNNKNKNDESEEENESYEDNILIRIVSIIRRRRRIHILRKRLIKIQ